MEAVWQLTAKHQPRTGTHIATNFFMDILRLKGEVLKQRANAHSEENEVQWNPRKELKVLGSAPHFLGNTTFNTTPTGFCGGLLMQCRVFLTYENALCDQVEPLRF